MRRGRIFLQLIAASACMDALVVAQEPPPQGDPAPQPEKEIDLFHDPEDQAFDISNYLATRTGFLPILTPITEPAVGYGLGGGLVFFHDHPRMIQTPAGPRMIPPNATVLGGMATENGSWAAGAGHLHNWDDGNVRYVVGGGYGSLNLDWFGQGNAFHGRSFSYNIEALAVLQKLTFKLGDSDFFAGPTQKLLATKTRFDNASSFGAPGAPADIGDGELDSTISGLGLTLGYDTRNSMFSPTQGMKASLDWTQNDEAIGSDFDYGRIGLEVCQYVPLGGPFTLGMRGDADFASDDAPFFDLPAIHLRGIQAGRYVDNTALTFEGEVRWDVTRRWTLVGFGGVGWVSDELDQIDDAKGRSAGGVGFRYLVAAKYDLRMGLDVAVGPEDEAIYVTVGTGWLRD